MVLKEACKGEYKKVCDRVDKRNTAIAIINFKYIFILLTNFLFTIELQSCILNI